MQKLFAQLPAAIVGSIFGVIVGYHVFPLQHSKPVLAQQMKAEVVAVYQKLNGAWETVVAVEDGTRIIFTERKLGVVGDKFDLWKHGPTSWLQNPNP